MSKRKKRRNARRTIPISIEVGEAVTVSESVADYSFDQMREFLQDELNEEMGTESSSPFDVSRPYVVDVYPDRVIFRKEGDLYQVDYTVSDTAGGPEATFGSPVEVFVTYKPTGESGTEESLREAGAVLSKANLAKVKAAVDALMAVMKAAGMMQESLSEADTLTASVGGAEHPASDFAYVPHSKRPSSWKFPIFDKAHVDNASARINQTDIPAKDLPAVKAKIRAAWKKYYPDKKPADMPDAIKEGEGDESDGLLLIESGLAEDMVTPLLEAAIREDGTMPIKIISPGWGSTGYYSREVLEQAASKFPAGTQMFLNHATRAERAARPEGDITKLAATLTEDAHFLDHAPAGYKAKDDGAGLYAEARVVETHRQLLEDLAPHIGLSINGSATNIKYGEAEGRRGPIIEGIAKADSVDFVTRPGRGGEVLQIMESYRETEFPTIETEVKDMNEDEARKLKESNEELESENKRLTEALILREAGDVISEVLAAKEYDQVSDLTKKRISEALSKNPPVKDEKLDRDTFENQIKETVKAEIDYLAQITGAGKVTGSGGSSSQGSHEVQESADVLHKRRVERFKRQGLSEAAAEAAAKGRK